MSLRPAPLGFAEGTAAASMTGATIAHCFTFTNAEPRGLHGLVARVCMDPGSRYAMGEIRYLRPEGITRVGKRRVRRSAKYLISTSRDRDFILFSIVVNGFHRCGCFREIDRKST